MSKTEGLKKELEKLGIYDTKDLREAMKHVTLDVSLMAAMAAVPGKVG
ncbi:MAG: hypothetical protein IJN64_10940 [Lachnospiraceae bacterium]|nr:hypothetical protein [Lachnospiraceae bacterium]